MLGSQRQRLLITPTKQHPSIEAIIAAMQVVGHVREHFAQLDGLLQSASGIAPVVSASQIAQLPELGRLNRRGIAALAHMSNDSGNRKDRLGVQGGRFEIQRVL